MNKLIIRNYTDLSDLEILNRVMSVVQNGKISTTSRGPQYCFISLFKDNIVVGVSKSKTGTETFYVYKEGEFYEKRKNARD